jgi:hypothetical protein
MASKPGESPAVSVDRNGYAGAPARGKVASDADSQNRFGPSSKPSDQPVLNPVATSPLSNSSSVLVDFESTDSMRDRRGAWDLLSDNVVVGTLHHKRNAQLADLPAGNAARPQGRCLLLRGHSDEVEFRPADTNSRIDRVQFLALRQSAGLPCKLVIEAKSRERFERWQVISEFEIEFDGIEFSRIEIGPHQFSQAESRKFRFKIVGNQESGVYIDDLEIHLR